MSIGIQYPWPELTKAIGSMLPGEMTVILGDSGSGKSTVVDSIVNGAIEQDTAILLGTFEIYRKPYLLKRSCKLLKWDYPDIKQGNIAKWGDRETLEEVYRNVVQQFRDVKFMDGLNLSVDYVLSELENWLTSPKVQAKTNRLFVPDHILQISYGKNGEATTGSIRSFLNEALNLCKEYNCHFLPTSQLSPAGSFAYRSGKQPDKDHGFGSSALKHLADSMLFIGGKPLPKQKKGLSALTLGVGERYEAGKGMITVLKSRDYGIRYSKEEGKVVAGEGFRLVLKHSLGGFSVDHTDELNKRIPTKEAVQNFQRERKEAAKDFLETVDPGSSIFSKSHS